MERVLLYFCFFLFSVVQLRASATLDSLRSVFLNMDSTQVTQEYLEARLTYAYELLQSSKLKEANTEYERILQLTKGHSCFYCYLESYIGVAKSFFSQGRYELALEKAYELIDKVPEDSLSYRGRLYRIIGDANVYQGDFNKAYQAQIKALDIFKNLNDSSIIARVEFSLGSNFYYQEQYDLSKQHFENALNLCTQLNLTEGIYTAYGAIGSIYEREGDLNEALRLNELALDMASGTSDLQGVAWTLLNIGSLKVKMDEFEKGLEVLEKARVMSQDMGDVGLEGYLLAEFAYAYQSMEEYDQALKYLSESATIATQDNDRNSLIDLYDKYAEVYFLKKDYRNYKKYIDKYQALKDSVHHEDLAESLSSLKQDYEIKQLQKEQRIQLLEKEAEVDMMRTRSNLFVFFAIAVVSFLIFLILLLRNRSAKKQNRILQMKNEEIRHQNELLFASNQDLEKFAQVISHDLKEPLRSISGFSSLLKRRLNRSGREDPQSLEYMEFIEKGANQMSKLLTGLLDYSKLGKDNEDALSLLDVDMVLGEVLQSLSMQIGESGVEIIKVQMPEIQYNQFHLHQLFLNLIGNAIKFNKNEHPIIELGVEENDHFFKFFVKDNGIGIAPEYHDKIFEVFQRLHDRESYSGSGIGLSTCKKIVEKYGGRMELKSEVGSGSTFCFTVPKNLENKGANWAMHDEGIVLEVESN